MRIQTTRFGLLDVDDVSVIHFSGGLLGLEDCRDWVILPDQHNECLGWLQSVDRPRMAFAVVSPVRFVPDYSVRVFRREIEPLGLAQPTDAQVLVIVGKSQSGLTLNLKAPLMINAQRRLGRQVIHNGDQPLQFALAPEGLALRKTA